MYTTMLEEAVRKMKGEEDKPAHANTVINLGISVRIDSDYIPEENQRLRMYKRIAGAQTQADLTDVRAELQDRYGTPPETVLNLLAAGEIRLHCEQLGIRDFKDAVRDKEIVVGGAQRELWSARKTGRLTEKDLARVNRLIQKLLASASPGSEKGQLYGVTVLLTPVNRLHRGPEAGMRRRTRKAR